MTLAYVIALSVLALWHLINLAVLAVSALSGSLLSSDIKIAVYWMVTSIATIAVSAMACLYVAEIGGLIGR